MIPGRVRIALCRRLREAGIEVHPDNLVLNRDKEFDVARWNGERATILPPHSGAGRVVDLYSWDRMGDCAREGVVLGEREQLMLEVHRRGPQ